MKRKRKKEIASSCLTFDRDPIFKKAIWTKSLSGGNKTVTDNVPSCFLANSHSSLVKSVGTLHVCLFMRTLSLFASSLFT